jgi:flagellar basal body-associated protein FliL
MSAAAPVATGQDVTPSGKKNRKLLFAAVGVVAILAGAALPLVVDISSLLGKPKEGAQEKPHAETKTAIVPFGDMVVNLADERAMRYLRVKLAVLVDADKEKEVSDLLTKKKPAVKSKLISHLAGKTLKDVSGTVGVNRLQREILERFEEVLYPEGHSPLRAILFEEYVVQ